MGKTVMRPRMKRGISIAAAVACSFTLIPAVNAVQGGGATANAVVDRPADSRISKVAGVIEKGTSIFDDPASLKKIQEMKKAAIERGIGNANANSPTNSALRNLYAENGVELPYNSTGASNNWSKGYTFLAAHLDTNSETLYEKDGLGKGSDYSNSHGSFTDETYVGNPVVYVRHAGQKEFQPAAASQFFNNITARNGSGSHSDTTDSNFYSEAYVDYRFVAPKDFNGEVILSIPSGSSTLANDRLTERLFVVTSDSNPYNPGVTDNNTVTPVGKDLTTDVGKLPEAKEGIGNTDKLPDGTKYEWVKKPDVSKPGKSTGTVKVTTPDGKATEVEVTVTVTDPNAGQKDADKYTPQANPITTPKGTMPAAADGIKNKSEMPPKTKFEWQTAPNVDRPGNTEGTIKVNYPDGSSETVKVPVTVKDTANLALKNPAKGQNISTPKGVVPDAVKGISNSKEMPDGTTYEWAKEPDVSTVGTKDATVRVKYSDGSKNEVPIKVTVTDPKTDAQKKPAVGQDITTKVNVDPKAESGIKNMAELPKGTTPAWEKKPDVSKPGDTTGTIKVTYPDKSTQSVPVKVHVTGAADENTPKPKQITVPRGKAPKAEDGIANKDELPKDTKYTWKTTPDTSKPGDTTGTVVVTYPDGSKDEVKVPIKVTSDADKYAPKPQDVDTGVGVVPPASDGISNKDDLPKDTKYEWVKEPDVSKPGETTGTIKVTYPDGSSETVDVRVMVTQDIYISDISKQANGDYKVTRNDGKTWTIDLHSLNDRISKNEKRIADLEKGVKANKDGIAKNKDAIDALRKENDDLKKQVEGLKKSAQDADKRLDELEKQAKDQGKTLDNLVKDNKTADDAIKNLTKQVTDLKKQQEAIKGRLTSLESRVTILETTVKGLQSNAHAWAQCFSGIGTSAIPVLLALPLGLAAQADVPGIGNVNAEVQKKLGIFNPAAAKWVSENRGIMQMAAGVLGFAGILGAMVHAAQDCGPYAKDDYVKDTDLGKLSSKMDSIKDGNTEGSSIDGGSSLGDTATEGGSSLGEGSSQE